MSIRSHKARPTKKYDAVIAGYTCVDIIPEFKNSWEGASVPEIFIPGSLVEMGDLRFHLGGVVNNTGVAMKIFGNEVFLNGLVGKDQMGCIAMRMLEELELQEGIESTDVAQTAASIVLAPSGIDRIFLESPGCSQIFSMNHIRLDAISNSRLFHFGYPPLLKKFFEDGGTMLVELFKQVKQLGATTSLDMSLVDPGSDSGKVDWQKILASVLPLADIFVPSIEEILQILMPEEYAELKKRSVTEDFLDHIPVDHFRKLGRKLLESGAKIIFIKAGHRGSYLLTGDLPDVREESWKHRELWCHAYPADLARVKNTSGSGDIAVAGFLTAFLRGLDPLMAMKFAGIAGRNNLYCNSLKNDLASWADMEAEIINSDETIEHI